MWTCLKSIKIKTVHYKNLILAFLLLPCLSQAQCLEDVHGIIWKGKKSIISFRDLASHAAPMLWFSPDEILLYREDGVKQLPNAFPFEEQGEKPVVYYKIRRVYGQDRLTSIINPTSENANLKLLDLKSVRAIDLDFYYYFEKETGPSSHDHDIESITLQVQVVEPIDCSDYNFAINVKKVIGRAHGNHWYNNAFTVDEQTSFPLSILIEEGKHASCTDKNADGVYTPTYDVTERINDAWGVRDIITSGRLVTGGFQAWMAKRRDLSSIVFPPVPETSPHYESFIERYDEYTSGSEYELRPYPMYKKLKEAKMIDKSLDHFMRPKKPHDWPHFQRAIGSGNVKQWIKEEKSYTSLSLAYRWDDSQRISFSFPLLLLRNFEAPKTGGWLYNKVYLGDFDSVIKDSEFAFEKLMGHQITYSSSASRWIDTYIGLGYEIYDINPDKEITNYDAFFVSEAGIKLRVNIERTPLKFLRHLGTDFWGIRIGWKNLGFSPFVDSGFVVEIGAGVF